MPGRSGAMATVYRLHFSAMVSTYHGCLGYEPLSAASFQNKQGKIFVSPNMNVDIFYEFLLAGRLASYDAYKQRQIPFVFGERAFAAVVA